jgi:molecular chaperone DnaK (HSP70)|tara:strand:- start:1503 stop:2132 length:630 start_codon:yes stop_codon:yes gene_type:complete
MSYSKTKNSIEKKYENPPKDTHWFILLFGGLGVFCGFLFLMVTGAFLLLIPLGIIWGVIYLFINKKDEKIEFHDSTIDSLQELSKEQKTILDKWSWKFKTYGLDTIEYEERVQIEDLIEEYDRKSTDYDDLENHLNTISQENPQKIKVLKDEISHFGDTIDENDEEYISRMKKIKSFKKEIKQTELDLKNLDKERQKTEDKILSLVGNN